MPGLPEPSEEFKLVINDEYTVKVKRWREPDGPKLFLEYMGFTRVYLDESEEFTDEDIEKLALGLVQVAPRAIELDYELEQKRLKHYYEDKECCADYVVCGSDNISKYGSWKGKSPPWYRGKLDGVKDGDKKILHSIAGGFKQLRKVQRRKARREG